MNPIIFFPSPRSTATKSPITLVRQVSRLSVGAAFTISLAIFSGASAPAASAQAVTYMGSGAVNFGSANVCLSGKTTPAPCSQTMTLSYTVTASGTLGTPQALTLGAPNLDYKLASGSTCAGSVIQGNSCAVKVTFAPIAPGARNGAVEIVDGSGKVLATTYIYGNGVGPLIGYGPPVLTLTSTFGDPSPSGIAIDASGNIFISYNHCDGGGLEEIQTVDGKLPVNPVVHFPLPNSDYQGDIFPQGVAVDGAGNLFFTNYSVCGGGGPPSTVIEVLKADGYATPITINSRFNEASSIAVDGSGNVFVIDGPGYTNEPSTVKELVASSGYTMVNTLGGGFAFDDPAGLSVDASGNVFIADYRVPDGSYKGAVEEIPAAGGYKTVKTIHVSSASNQNPSGVAVDSAENLFVIFGTHVAEFFAVDGAVPPQPAAVHFSNGVNDAAGIALDGHGNIFTAAIDLKASGYLDGLVQQLSFSTPPVLSFASTPVGGTSSDSPKSLELHNRGNGSLGVTSLSVSPNWDPVPGSGNPEDCTASFSLLPSAVCNLSISFEPKEAGPLTGAVSLVDNSLNTAGSAQSVALSGSGETFPPPQVTSLSNTYGAPYSVVILNGINFGATQGSSTVTFNGIATPHYFWASTKIYVTVPPGATTGNLTVNVGGESSTPIVFPVLPQPVITGISPTSANEGTLVTITGKNLVDYENHARAIFDSAYTDAETSINVLSGTRIQVQVPFGVGLGPGHFHVLVNDTGMNTSTFTVTK
jgi:hypothetical protein